MAEDQTPMTLDTDEALREVLEDVMSDLGALAPRIKALKAQPATHTAVEALTEGAALKAMADGGMDLASVVEGCFHLGFLSGVTFQQRGYRL